jgi:hypothetical protein
MYRQGDVLLVPVRPADVPASAVPAPRDRSGRMVLARGEVTGQSHVINGTSVEVLTDRDDIDRLFVRVDGQARLSHDERPPVMVPTGSYRVMRQREYVPGQGGALLREPLAATRAPEPPDGRPTSGALAATGASEPTSSAPASSAPPREARADTRAPEPPGRQPTSGALAATGASEPTSSAPARGARADTRAHGRSAGSNGQR